jgi:ribulose-5-phosphate 4-epimerase/fuculose-1-phosphate aldolase
MKHSRPWPSKLDEVSMQIGQKNFLVQGPGGNTSWKHEGNLWVKASGYQLKDAISKEIFCQVNIENPLVNVNSDGKRPSIESTLHSIRPEQFVVHVHSINTVSLGCRRELEVSARKFLKHFQINYLEYHRPGENLANAIQSKNYNVGVKGLLLANHGLVLWGEDIFDLWHLLIEIEAELDEMYPTNIDLLEKIKSETLIKYLSKKHLTPDHAVFDVAMSQSSFSENLLWLIELRNALEISVAKISRVEDIQFISDEESIFLKQWEAEKLRQKMNS